MANAIFGSERKDGDFLLPGNLAASDGEITLSACTYKLIEDGKCLSIYGLCTAWTGPDIKYKKDGEWTEMSIHGELIRFDIVAETFTKEYRGNKNKKEATPLTTFLAKSIREAYKEDEPFALYANFGAPEDYITAVETGKSKKGTDISPEVIEEFKEEIYVFNELDEASKETLEKGNKAERSSYGGGYRAPSSVQPKEKYAQICEIAGIEGEGDKPPSLETVAEYFTTIKASNEALWTEMRFLVTAICQ